MALLALAFARPQTSVQVPVEEASIMLVTDHSRSMLAQDVEPDRMTAAKRAANRFLDQIPSGIESRRDDLLRRPRRHPAADARPRDDPPHDRQPGRRRRHRDSATRCRSRSTSLDRQQENGEKVPAAIVLLSDGATTIGRDPVAVAHAAGEAKIPIYTIALGTSDATVPNPEPGGAPLPVPPDPETLQAIADSSNGRAFQAQDDQQLSEIHETLGSRLGTRAEKREVTFVFAVAAGLLLLGAAASALVTRGRLP